ncbi:hypothetical protein U14_02096 [Candidatus Moduliflexus flocculans]|uniref:Uncharacterized protein n=1 Tax=Candidatus Moduliflexus flocculans TaxID=1499966 RepID=A0A0S6VTU2_9BACT|nr:hypothetical protein U14_02096 [Candidatus Moduliflexus flocculans]
MKKKPFDCVEMKRQAAEHIYERIREMTIEEELHFWNATMAAESAAPAPNDNDAAQWLETPVAQHAPKRRKQQPERRMPLA